MRCRRLAWVSASATVTVTLWLVAAVSAQTPARALEGMWSDAPDSIVGRLCNFVCSDVAIDALNALIDDPANDAVPYIRLRAQALEHHIDYVRSRLTPLALKTFPLDPADDPSFLRCEPWGLARQIFAPHQLQIRSLDGDRVELRYGEWDAHRFVYLNGRSPEAQAPSRLGRSVGRWDGQTFVISTTGIAGGRALVTIEENFEHSAQLTISERYTRASDGKSLMLTATLTDPVSLKEPVTFKHMWRWAPESKITPYDQCEIPTEFKRGVKP
jgi:hypothetical protein